MKVIHSTENRSKFLKKDPFFCRSGDFLVDFFLYIKRFSGLKMVGLMRENMSPYLDEKEIKMSKETKNVGLKQLANTVAEKTGITQTDSLLVVKAVFEALKEEILRGSKVMILGFGSFFTTLVEERTAGNPQNPGERVVVPPHYRARWKASNTFKAELKEFKPTEEELAALENK